MSVTPQYRVSELATGDRDRLLSAEEAIYKQRRACPADALAAILNSHGYPVSWWELLGGESYEIDWETPALMLSEDVPMAEIPYAVASALAELRLGYDRMPKSEYRRKSRELYASTFLMPLALMEKQPGWSDLLSAAPHSPELSQALGSIAAACCVSSSRLRERLENMGLLAK